MKQVNMWMDDDLHMLLVKEAARRQLAVGKILTVSKLSVMLVKESLNGKPDNEQDSKQEDNPIPTNEATETPANNPFHDLKF